MFESLSTLTHFSMEWQASFAFLSRSHSLTQVNFFFLFLGFQFYHNVSRTIQVENHKSLVFNFKIHHSLHEKTSFINHSFLTYNIYLKNVFIKYFFSTVKKLYSKNWRWNFTYCYRGVFATQSDVYDGAFLQK